MSASLIGHSGSSAFRLIHHYSVDVAHGRVLLYGIGTRAVPSWDSKTGWNNLSGGLVVSVTTGPSGHANSPHPPARDIIPPLGGARFSLLLDLILHGFHAATAACSRVQRNSVP